MYHRPASLPLGKLEEGLRSSKAPSYPDRNPTTVNQRQGRFQLQISLNPRRTEPQFTLQQLLSIQSTNSC